MLPSFYSSFFIISEGDVHIAFCEERSAFSAPSIPSTGEGGPHPQQEPAPEAPTSGDSLSWTDLLRSSTERTDSSGQGQLNDRASASTEEVTSVPPFNPYPYHDNEMVGGDSVRTIQSRLLSNNPEPSFEEIQRAHIDAQDRFEVKVEILRQMATLDPDGDWERRGARALDNPHTSTGKFARNLKSCTWGESFLCSLRILVIQIINSWEVGMRTLVSFCASVPGFRILGLLNSSIYGSKSKRSDLEGIFVFVFSSSDRKIELALDSEFWAGGRHYNRPKQFLFLFWGSEVKAKASWSLPSSVESDFPFDSGLDWLRAIHRSIGTRASKSFLWANGESSRSGLKSNPQLLPLRFLPAMPLYRRWVGYSLIWAYKRAWGLEVGEGVRLGEYPDFSFSAVFDFGAGVSVTRLLLSIPSTESKKKKSYTCTMGLDRYACRILPNPLTSSLASQAVNFIEPSSLLSMLPLSFPPGSSLQQMRSHMRKRTVLVIGSYPDLEFSLPSRVKGMRSQGEREEKRLVESLFANILIWKSSFCGKDPPHSTTSQRSSYWLRKQSIVKFSQVNYFSALAVQSPY
ncbi:UNVERIFIED_CONTAM: putative mitochondrial protein [Sesamum calycinum]|uniref:Mitochondrial protein n=1 Tax=Sesamum calycinum TaxID=2727403 RepID=A0AAW2JKN9_9LAMI